MPIPTGRYADRRSQVAAALAVLTLLAACSSAQPSPSTPAPSPSGSAVSVPTPIPTATPLPTPRFTNPPDAELSALIPSRLRGTTVAKPAPSAYGLTPGDFGSVFGDLGLRFQSLVVAFVEKPRLSLYAARVAAPLVATADLKPYLAAAGEYVGVHGLRPAAWKAAVVGGHQVWTRGEDTATLPGTTFYCWSAGQYVFLITGSSDTFNRAMVAALPGQAVRTPTPRPTGSPSASGSSAGSAGAAPSGSGSPSQSPT
jgi:hypothetical protein